MKSSYSFFNNNYPHKLLVTMTGTLLLSTSAMAASTSSREAFFLKRIAEYYKEGDLSTTRHQIENFLQQYPESSAKDSLYPVLGDIYIENKLYEMALNIYQKISSEEDLRKVSYGKAICLWELKRDEELIDHINKALASPLTINEPETLRYFLASALLKKAQNMEGADNKPLLRQALSHLEQLNTTKYAGQTLSLSADLAASLEEGDKASHLYKRLLELSPLEREEILYKMALMQEKCKPEEAVKTFGQVYKLRGKKAPDAALKQLETLFHLAKYKELLLYQEEAKRHIADEKRPFYHYLVGKSLFQLEDFSQAQRHMLIALDDDRLSQTDQVTIIKNLIYCGGKTKDHALIKTLIGRWEEIDKNNPDIADAYLLCYQQVQNKNPKLASDLLAELLEKYPHHKEREAILYNLASLEFKLEHWKSSSDLFTELQQGYPQGKYSPLALRYLIKTKTEELNCAAAETLHIKRAEVIDLLHAAIKSDKIFSEEEKNHLSLSLAQLMVESGTYEEALDILLQYIEVAPSPHRLSKAYLLTARCYETTAESPALFVSFAEKALRCSDCEISKGQLHTKLYNAYLNLASVAVENEKQELIHKGALHLLSAYKAGAPVKSENIHWLAEVMYKNCQSKMETLTAEDNQTLSDAIDLMQDVLGIHSYPPRIDLSKSNRSSEIEMLQLADLLGWQGKISEKLDTLEVLVYAQKTIPTIPWKMHRSALLELARCYKDCGQIDEAIDTYGEIVKASEYTPSLLASRAKFEKVCLEIDVLKKNNIVLEDERWQSALDTLKDLQIQKRIFSEPVHLEAALTYVEYKTEGLGQKERIEKTIVLLEKVKESFTDKNNQETAAYLEGLSKYPDRASIYSKYMDLIDSVILLKKGEIAQLKHDAPCALDFKKKGLISLKELSKEDKLPSALKDRIAHNMEGEHIPL